MRIMQVNSYVPIRQNKMTFKGENQGRPLLQHLAELDERVRRRRVTQEEAERECQKIFDEAGIRLITDAGTPDDAKALMGSGEKLVHIILSGLSNSTSSSQRQAVLDRAGAVSKAVDAIILEAYKKSKGEILINVIHRIIRPYRNF